MIGDTGRRREPRWRWLADRTSGCLLCLRVPRPARHPAAPTASGRASGFELIPGFTLANYATAATSGLYQAVFLRTIGRRPAVAAHRRARRVRAGLPPALRLRRRRGQSSSTSSSSPCSAATSCASTRGARSWAARASSTRAARQLGLIAGAADVPRLQQCGHGHHARRHAHPTGRAAGLLVDGQRLAATTWRAPRTSARGASACTARSSCRWSCPALSTAFAIAFILAAGDFVVPQLVGGTSGLLAGNLVADQFRGLGTNWPLGATLSFLILAVVVAVYLLVTRLVTLGHAVVIATAGRSRPVRPLAPQIGRLCSRPACTSRSCCYLFLPRRSWSSSSRSPPRRDSACRSRGSPLSWYRAALAEPLF